MPKEYFCTKLTDMGLPCGERDETKFIEGRYSTCRSCRLKFMSEYNKTKTNKGKEQKNKQIDPDCNIRYLIEDTIIRVPLISNQTIVERMEDTEHDVSRILLLHHEYVDKSELKMEKLEKQIKTMSNYIKILLTLLPENKLEELEKINF
jgi:hypothetical protein